MSLMTTMSSWSSGNKALEMTSAQSWRRRVGGVGLYDFECGVWRPLSLEASSSYCTAALHSE